MSKRAKQKAAQIDLVRRLGSRDPEIAAQARVEFGRLVQPMIDQLADEWAMQMRPLYPYPDSLDKRPNA